MNAKRNFAGIAQRHQISLRLEGFGTRFASWSHKWGMVRMRSSRVCWVAFKSPCRRNLLLRCITLCYCNSYYCRCHRFGQLGPSQLCRSRKGRPPPKHPKFDGPFQIGIQQTIPTLEVHLSAHKSIHATPRFREGQRGRRECH